MREASLHKEATSNWCTLSSLEDLKARVTGSMAKNKPLDLKVA